MAIVPSGHRRRVVAQGLDMNSGYGIENSINEGENIPTGGPVKGNEPPVGNIPPEETAIKDKPGESNDFVKVPDQENVKSEEAHDVSQYIFNKLQQFGYPARRLEQFEEEFVREKLYPGGSREIEIAIPDRYYGKKTRISDKDFASIVKEIQTKFGLSFSEAERKDKKIVMQFSYDATESENSDEEDMAGDILDEVYGGGGGASESQKSSNKPKKPATKKMASTISEMIKEHRKSLFDAIIKGAKI